MARRRLDFQRERRGLTGKLALLRFRGQETYEPLIEIPDGWGGWFKSDRTSDPEKRVPILQVEIEVTGDGERDEAVRQAVESTEFEAVAVEGVVYAVEKDNIHPPLLD
ncbi:MAG TPA: hypothetical protein VGV38_03535, partial [Pyrinomonadaceae bacterium]|nr:hypothetical protein [Pyrinomonadaceae bacterium]